MIDSSVVHGCVGESGAADEPVLRLHERVRHPVVVVALRVAESLDAHLGADEATSEGSTADLGPLHGAELSAAEVRSETGSAHEHGGRSSSSESHSGSESAPATLSLKELFLAEEEAVGRLHNLVSGVVPGVVVLPAGKERSVRVLFALSDGACEHAGHCFSFQ